MEKDRGSEFDFCGGSGGEGCLAIGYYDGATAAHTAEFPEGISSLMIIADQSKSWAKDQAQAPLHFGGITKNCWKINLDNGVSLEDVPCFWVAETSGEPTGVMTFRGDAAESATELLNNLPKGWQKAGDYGLFPCFTRGVNQYGKKNVETTAIGSLMAGNPPARVYGMFAHGELGPSNFAFFTSEAGNKIDYAQHGMSGILTIHTTKAENAEFIDLL